ncbi:piggyBac transposable element-derived protein 4-like [Dreissena polymorpha]|uniref:piggyBac transposable element-derived protein 4-like n=1 Tax=Dreissena polymorpha TaxID=45954 RepID=UPI002264B8B8|nr:piggyBac transposable element-derived protein 4-like [Dreissena polymorpha]
MEKLLEDGLYSCSTVRVNRKQFPVELKKPKDLRERGQFKILQRGTSNLTASVWRDKKLVHHVSTLSDPTLSLQAQRRTGAEVLNLQQPHAVKAYCQYMGGVDVHDQYRLCYEVGRNSKKWWRYLFWFMINTAIVNAYLLFKETSKRRHSKKRFGHLDFREELAEHLIGGYTKRKRASQGQAQAGLINKENVGPHVHAILPGKRRRCKYHSLVLKERTDTRYGCTTCMTPLCCNMDATIYGTV